jgi:hypothetical protein
VAGIDPVNRWWGGLLNPFLIYHGESINDEAVTGDNNALLGIDIRGRPTSTSEVYGELLIVVGGSSGASVEGDGVATIPARRGANHGSMDNPLDGVHR